MKKMNLILAFVLILGTTSAFASGGGMNLSVAAAGNYGLNSATVSGAGVTGSVKGGLGYGGGLLVGFPLGSSSDFEVGGVYSVYTFTTSLTILGKTTDTTSHSHAIHIPGVVHFMMGHAISLGAGGWYDVGVGSSSGSSDYGAQAGIRFHFGSKLFFDAAYNMGLKDNAGTKTSGISALLGYSFGK